MKKIDLKTAVLVVNVDQQFAHATSSRVVIQVNDALEEVMWDHLYFDIGRRIITRINHEARVNVMRH